MKWSAVLGLLFTIFVVFLLGVYWLVPFGEQINFEFINQDTNYNFSSGLSENTSMQFYKNMRYPNKEISYKISDCPLGKKEDMQRAISTLDNLTVVDFYSVNQGEEISISCDSHTKIEGGLFIAGEGGPTNITITENFNVIKNGQVLLLRDSKCANPNVGLHELLHALGFDHSTNPKNIMYPVSRCDQTIGQDTIDFIDFIYSFPSKPDLSFENISASKKGTALDLNLTIRNNGLQDAGDSVLVIYADGKELERTDLIPLGIGQGQLLVYNNIFVIQRNVENIGLEIIYMGEELDKENNKAELKVKNQ